MKLNKEQIRELAKFIDDKQIECGFSDAPLEDTLRSWISNFVALYYSQKSNEYRRM